MCYDDGDADMMMIVMMMMMIIIIMMMMMMMMMTMMMPKVPSVRRVKRGMRHRV